MYICIYIPPLIRSESASMLFRKGRRDYLLSHYLVHDTEDDGRLVLPRGGGGMYYFWERIVSDSPPPPKKKGKDVGGRYKYVGHVFTCRIVGGVYFGRSS